MTVREEHSKKPDELRDRIEVLCGEVPKIELFARVEYEGWDQMGNQIDKFQPKSQTNLLDFF